MFAAVIVPVRATGKTVDQGDRDLLLAAGTLAGRTVALCLGSAEAARELDGLCQECLVSDHPHPDALDLTALVRSRLTERTAVLVRHDSLGMDVGPGLAVAMGTPLVTNISGLTFDGPDAVVVFRPERAGQSIAEYRVDVASGAVLTVMPGALPTPAELPGLQTDFVILPGVPSRRRFLGQTEAGFATDISSVPLLVAVGRGLGSAEAATAASRLAEELGGQVCCSRAAADAGWLPKDRQVGISGQTVSPSVYLALGLHGSFQHMVGVQGNPLVVAVNTNPDAPIFRRATIGARADAATIASMLIEILKE